MADEEFGRNTKSKMSKVHLYEDEKRDEKAEEEKRKKMMEGWSDRDRNLLEEAKQAAKEKLEAVKKELNKNVGDAAAASSQPVNAGEALAFALYDGGDAKSRHNQIVRQIENDPSLSEAEKEALLRNHFQSLTGIDEMMDAERRRQEAELEKAIKDRVDRRKKALESKFKKEINQEVKEGEQIIKDEIETRKIEQGKAIDREIDGRLEDAARGDKGAYRRSVDELKKER